MRELSEFLTGREIYVLDHHPAMSYKAIGAELGISPERVRQLKVHAERLIRAEKQQEQAEEKAQLPITLTIRRKDLWIILRSLEETRHRIYLRDIADQRLKKGHEIDPDFDQVKNLIDQIKELQEQEATTTYSAWMQSISDMAAAYTGQEPFPVYDLPHNLQRKAAVLAKCIARLERLQEDFAPIFSDDPMIQGYLRQMREDLQCIQKVVTPPEKK